MIQVLVAREAVTLTFPVSPLGMGHSDDKKIPKHREGVRNSKRQTAVYEKGKDSFAVKLFDYRVSLYPPNL